MNFIYIYQIDSLIYLFIFINEAKAIAKFSHGTYYCQVRESHVPPTASLVASHYVPTFMSEYGICCSGWEALSVHSGLQALSYGVP